ncbi:hypothetical protein L916_18268 [Phytophthora nicotianae]|uniref:Coiled-coil domain-containing protein n=1 Tax=Phytophthora nicotianae TaxID=4792 RepID=W2I4H6_PHYNI|nr:hypothetical protein L916_18268 [Phytophthora nicotianae]
MHQSTRTRPLGRQQLQRLRRLREANDNAVREEHLNHSGGVPSSLYDVQQPEDPLASRTVDAIVQERLQSKGNVSTSARLRDKVAASRRGVQTERSERPGDELRPTKPKTKIVAVRRRGGTPDEKSDSRRRMGKLEAEWMEKKLQYKTRVATLERECRNAWQGFFAGAGASTSSTGFVSPTEVNKLFEEMETLREEDVHKMKHQLSKLSSKLNDVQMKVEEIANGDHFFSELQERIDAMEAALAKFRLEQLQHFEGYVLEEKVLEKELAAFMEKMESWENEPQLSRGGASSTSLGSRWAHLSSKSSSNLHALTSRGQSERNNGDESVNCSGGNQEEDQTVITGTPDEIGMINRVRRLNEAILRSGGLMGGWDNPEHATFTTLLVKCGLTDDVLLQHSLPEDLKTHTLRYSTSNQDTNHEGQTQTNSQSDYETRVARFLRKCMRKIVTQTDSSIRSHFEWYLRHLELVEEKKGVIQGWKMRKEEERQQIIQCGFDADGNVLGSFDGPENSRDASSREQSDRAKQKSREKTERLLEQWKRVKKQKEEEQAQRRQELQKKRDALEAKRKQEHLDAKQKIILYKLQKEQEAMMLDRTAKRRQDGITDDMSLSFSSPTSNEDLVERSRIAIEYAKAKRLRLQQIEERRQKQQRLPPRPETKTSDENAITLPKPAMVFNPTEASKARGLSKEEIRRKERRRERQNAHDAYIPGKKAIPDVKVKSFGHIPIQPRAVPAWRKNI